MTGWVCTECGRHFARTRQSHECSPAMTLEEYFSTGPSHERPVFDAVHDYLVTLGPIHIEPVSVGVFVKKEGSFVELRSMTRWVAMSFPLGRRIDHPKIARKPIDTGSRIHHVVNLHTPADLDDDVKSWLAESYSFVD
jgi:Domain of unknown function (DUF5655)